MNRDAADPHASSVRAHAVEEALDYKTLGVPVDEDADASGQACANCGQKAQDWVRFARAY